MKEIVEEESEEEKGIPNLSSPRRVRYMSQRSAFPVDVGGPARA